MRSSTTIFVLAAAAGFAAAQSTSPSSYHAVSGCGSQIDDIIANCLGTQTAQLNSCEVNDWACMCEQQNNVLTCYNNCPSDPRKAAADSQKVSWCGAAKAANPSSTSSSSHASMTMTATSGATSGSITSTASSNSATAMMPGATASPQESDSAAVANAVYPGALAAVFGLAAFL